MKAAIAGGGGAVGRALAEAFLSRGYQVAAGARARPRLLEALQGLDVATEEVDVTDAQSVARWRRATGEVDVLVYNVGRLDLGPLAEIDERSFRASFEQNALGAFLCAKAFLPDLAARGAGAMVFLGATSSVRGSPRGHAFSMSKHALRGLASSLAHEFGPRGVHVSHLVIDGKIWSPASERRFPGLARETCLEPSAVAQTVLHLVEQPASSWTFEADLRPASERWS